MKKLLVGLAILMASQSFAQSDILPTQNGPVKMTPIFHATTVLEWGGVTIFMDPYNGAESFSGFSEPDLVLITHAHGDHMNKETLEGLNLKNTTLIAPASVASELTNMGFKDILVLKNDEVKTIKGVEVEAVPMYNLPDDETSRHKRGWGNGYVLTLGGERFYFSGDTEDIPEMRSLKDIDYAFICMNLPYTMDVEVAASAVLDFKPRHVYPYHYRGGGGKFSDIEEFKKRVKMKDKTIDVRLRNWYN